MRTLMAKGLLIAAVASLAACVLQIIGLVRYTGRLPDDWIGITLFSVTIVAFLIAAIGFIVQFRKKPKE